MLRMHERDLWARGLRLVAGVDEAGVGPLAGPVVAAAVILPPGCELPGVDDSKKLTAEKRTALVAPIRAAAVAWCIAEATCEEIDRINIYQAGLLAMRRALAGLGVVPEHALVDGRTVGGLCHPETRIVGGDASELCIAAASILAKVHRDHLMEGLDALHPGYGFAAHKGYGTPAHLTALRALGPCAVHRRSFAPVQEALGTWSRAYLALVDALQRVRTRGALNDWRRTLRSATAELTAMERRRLRELGATRAGEVLPDPDSPCLF